MADTYRPLLAITMGHPAGIGLEIVVKMLSHASLYQRPLVMGDRRTLERAAFRVASREIDCDEVERHDEGRYKPGLITILNRDDSTFSGYPVGKVDATAGRAAVD